MRKKLGTIAAALVLSTVIPISSTYASSFVDIEGSYAKDAIIELQAKGVINGMDDTHFEPSGTLNRSQFAAIIVRSLGLEAKATSSTFTDVSDWSIPYVAAAYNAGIIEGVGNGKFEPNASITREAAATILVRALKTKGTLVEDATLLFTDANQVSDWAKPFIATAQKYKLINGFPDGSFKPKDTSNREMAAMMGKNLLVSIDLLVKATPTPTPTTSPTPTPAPSGGGGWGGGGGGGGVTPTTVVEFLIKPSFTGAFTSDMKVKINGALIADYSLYHNGELVGTSTNGIITTVNTVFSDASKVKIQYNSINRIDSDGKIGTW